MKRLILRAQGKKQKYFLKKKPENNSDSSLESLEEDVNIIGKLVNNKYLILKYLNRGTFCKVFIVLDIFNNELYALKVQNLEDNDELENEYNNLLHLQNINDINDKNYNLGKVYDKFELKINDNLHRCLLFELLGDSLDNIISNMDLTLLDIKNIIRQLLHNLNYLYKSNIIHCDLKLDNILLGNLSNNFNEYVNDMKNLNLSDKYDFLLKENLPAEFYNAPKNKRKLIKKKVKGKILKMLCKNEIDNINEINDKYNIFEYDDNLDNFDIKLIDFGNSEKIDQIDNETLYTRCYRPPENIINEEVYLKSDLWFVGCLLYELLTNEVLFNCDNIEGNKDKRDKRHLEKIYYYLGDIPKNLVFRNDEYNNDLFDKKGRLKNNNIDYDINNLSESIIENKKMQINDKELENIVDFIKNILKYNPEDRMDYELLLNHIFLEK